MEVLGSIETPMGLLMAVATDEALTALSFLLTSTASEPLLPKSSWTRLLGAEPLQKVPSVRQTRHPILMQAEAELAEYFLKQRCVFDVPLKPQGTDFQQRVWQSLQQIPYGQTLSYKEQAAAIGRPTACRAVAGANSRNPISIMIPCHRVIGSHGQLTGFASGLERKGWLLALEAQHPRWVLKV